MTGDIGSMKFKWIPEFALRVWRSYVCLGFLCFASLNFLHDDEDTRLLDTSYYSITSRRPSTKAARMWSTHHVFKPLTLPICWHTSQNASIVFSVGSTNLLDLPTNSEVSARSITQV
jgi:hypothetical protein